MTAETNNTNNQISSLNTTIKQMNAAAAEKETQLVNEYSQLQALESTISEQQSYMQVVLELLANTTG
jgi:flagellar capping protein FliD